MEGVERGRGAGWVKAIDRTGGYWGLIRVLDVTLVTFVQKHGSV